MSERARIRALSRVATIHAGIAAYNAGELGVFEDLVAETAIIVPFEGWPDDRVYYGPEGMVKLVTEWQDLFEANRLEVKEVVEADGRVVALMVMSGVQRGVRVEQKLGGLFDFDDEGHWIRVEYFLDYEEPLKALGA